MTHLFLVALGGALGASARYGAGLAALRLFGPGFPAGTLTVNIAGSLAMGLFAGYLALRHAETEGLRLFIATGFLGGFTTFSAFSLDAVALWERGDTLLSAIYVLASVTASILALFTGIILARAVWSLS